MQNKLECFALEKLFRHSLIFASKACFELEDMDRWLPQRRHLKGAPLRYVDSSLNSKYKVRHGMRNTLPYLV
jgi:hypothetical protein